MWLTQFTLNLINKRFWSCRKTWLGNILLPTVVCGMLKLRTVAEATLS